jgi:hypothetical protein
MKKSFLLTYFGKITLTTLIFFLVGSLTVIIISPDPALIEQSKFYKFLTILAAFGSAVIALNLLYDTERSAYQQELQLQLSTVAAIDRMWITQITNLRSSFSDAPVFVTQLLSQTLDPTILTEMNAQKPQTMDIAKTKVTETEISIRLFQSWEDYRTLQDQDVTGSYVWLCNFLMWAQSDILFEYWKKLQSNFALTTIIFGNFLFTKANELKLMKSQNGKLTTIDYYKMASSMVPKMNEIFNVTVYPNLNQPQQDWETIQSLIQFP